MSHDSQATEGRQIAHPVGPTAEYLADAFANHGEAIRELRRRLIESGEVRLKASTDE